MAVVVGHDEVPNGVVMVVEMMVVEMMAVVDVMMIVEVDAKAIAVMVAVVIVVAMVVIVIVVVVVKMNSESKLRVGARGLPKSRQCGNRNHSPWLDHLNDSPVGPFCRKGRRELCECSRAAEVPLGKRDLLRRSLWRHTLIMRVFSMRPRKQCRENRCIDRTGYRANQSASLLICAFLDEVKYNE
jgi:hypothetical protein